MDARTLQELDRITKWINDGKYVIVSQDGMNRKCADGWRRYVSLYLADGYEFYPVLYLLKELGFKSMPNSSTTFSVTNVGAFMWELFHRIKTLRPELNIDLSDGKSEYEKFYRFLA